MSNNIWSLIRVCPTLKDNFKFKLFKTRSLAGCVNIVFNLCKLGENREFIYNHSLS